MTASPYLVADNKTFLPTELLDAIICELLRSDYRFDSISGFATSCRAFRKIALRCFFMHLRVGKSERWRHIPDLADMIKSVKSLFAPTESLINSPVSLLSFHALRYVQVLFNGNTVLMQHQAVQQIVNSLPSTLTSLIFEDLADIGLDALELIGSRLPYLTRLELTCIERLDDACCWACFEESSTLVWHSPIPDLFSDATNLTTSIINALRPLTCLQHLFLGFFLSPEYLLQEHFSHVPEFDEEGNVVPPFGPEWCACCFEGYSAHVRADELQASLTLAQSFKELESVSWGSFFSAKISEIMERKTCIHIARKDGRIRVRRKPW